MYDKTYEVIKPFEFYTQIGVSKSNAYFGNAQISTGVYRKDMAKPGDLVVNGFPPVLSGGGKQVSVDRLEKPKDPLERSYAAPVQYEIDRYMVKRGVLVETDKQVRVDVMKFRNLSEKVLKPYMPSVVASERSASMNLDRIARNVFRKAISVEMEAPARIVTKQSQLMRSALALIKIFFGNQQDFREGVNKIKMLMSQGMTGIETTGMTPEQINEVAGVVAKNIWVRFNNAIPNDIQFRVAVMKQALHHIIGALFGAEAFKRSVFSMLDKKLGIDIEELGYTGDAKDELFSTLYMALRAAIKAAAPAAVGKVS